MSRPAASVAGTRLKLPDIGAEKIGDLLSDLAPALRKHPLKVALGAAALGLLVGLILRPRAA